MSERLEHHPHHEHDPQQVEKAPEHHEQAEHHRPRHEHVHDDSAERKKIEALRHEVEASARSKEDLTTVAAQEVHTEQPHYVNKELKDQALQRTLTRTRKKLSAPNRLLSHAIHQPVVDALSSTAEKTIARPIELFTGAFFALVGSSFALYMAKHYGFRYNLLLFFLLFASGFVFGIFIELALKLLRRSR